MAMVINLNNSGDAGHKRDTTFSNVYNPVAISQKSSFYKEQSFLGTDYLQLSQDYKAQPHKKRKNANKYRQVFKQLKRRAFSIILISLGVISLIFSGVLITVLLMSLISVISFFLYSLNTNFLFKKLKSLF